MINYSLNNFINFMTYIKYAQAIPSALNYKVDPFGNVYNSQGIKIKPSNSNGYKQVQIYDNNHNIIHKGIHQLVAETFAPDWFEGCVVHHIDEIKHNNHIENLKCETVSDHARHHANPQALIDWIKNNGPHNKGKKMSKEFCEKCRQAVKNRKRNPFNKPKFHGNQYTDKDGNKKEISEEDRKRFSDSAKRGAANRKLNKNNSVSSRG